MIRLEFSYRPIRKCSSMRRTRDSHFVLEDFRNALRSIFSRGQNRLIDGLDDERGIVRSGGGSGGFEGCGHVAERDGVFLWPVHGRFRKECELCRPLGERSLLGDLAEAVAGVEVEGMCVGAVFGRRAGGEIGTGAGGREGGEEAGGDEAGDEDEDEERIDAGGEARTSCTTSAGIPACKGASDKTLTEPMGGSVDL